MFRLTLLLAYLTSGQTMTEITKNLLTPSVEEGEACGYSVKCPLHGRYYAWDDFYWQRRHAQNLRHPLDLTNMIHRKDESIRVVPGRLQSCNFPIEGKLNIHVIPHTHAELGYTKTFEQHFTGRDDFYDKTNINMKRILDYVISELWANKNRMFTFSDLPYLYKWWSIRDETVHRMVYQLIRQGRLHIVGGGWSMTDESTANYQAIIDQFTYSLRKLNATFLECSRPYVTWQSDVFGHTGEFASLMAQMGFDGHFINPISYDDELERMRNKRMEFIWRGSSDLGISSEIFTHKLFDGYWSPPGFCFGGQCGDPLIIDSNTVFGNVKERVKLFVESMQYRQSPHYATNHLIVMMGQRMGYYDAPLWFQNIEKLMQAVNTYSIENNLDIVMYYSTPDCYLRAIHGTNVSFPVESDDFVPIAYDRYTHFSGIFTSRPTVKYAAREGNLYLQITKQLQVLARLKNHDRFFEEFHWIMGVLQDHNVLTGGMRHNVRDYYVNKIFNALQWSQGIITDGLINLMKTPRIGYRRCLFNISYCEYTDRDNYHIVIYNPLAWNITIPVRLPVSEGRFIVYRPNLEKVQSVIMKIPSCIRAIPFNRTKYYDFELVFIAENVPALGYRSYFIERNTRMKRSIDSDDHYKKKKVKNGEEYIINTIDEKFGNKTLKFRQQDNITKIDDEITQNDLNTTFKREVIVLEQSKNHSKQEREKQKSKLKNIKEQKPIKPKPDKTKDPKAKKLQKELKNLTKTNKPHETRPERSLIKKIKNAKKTYLRRQTNNLKIDDDSLLNNDRQYDDDYSNDEFENTTDINERYAFEQVTGYSEYFVTPTFKDDLRTPVEFATLSSKRTTEETTTETTTTTKKLDSASSVLSSDTTDTYISNEYINITTNMHNISHIALSNGLNMVLNINFYYYASDDPLKLDKPEYKKPGAYVFRPMDPEPVLIEQKFKFEVYKSSIVEEIHSNSAFASYVVRLYKNTPYCEVEWILREIPISDDIGKEVFIRYNTDLITNGIFYTDANGRQTMKRVYGQRPNYTPAAPEAIAGNFYPVTSKITIEDPLRMIRFSVFNDRTQGGSSSNGEIDLMLNRRILTDDAGVQNILNETENNIGTTVSGKHFIYITKLSTKINKIFEKKLAKEIGLKPQIFLPNKVVEKSDWTKYQNEFFGINKIPVGLNILTLQEWNDGSYLLRIENYLEKSHVLKTGIKKVILQDLFTVFRVVKVRETTLAGNIFVEDFVPLNWKKSGGNNDGLESLPVVNVDEEILFKPQQIRTFIIWVEFHE